MPGRSAFATRRAREPRMGHDDRWNEPSGWFDSGPTMNVTTYQDPPQTRTHGILASTANNQVQIDPYHLPNPPEGSKPPAGWDEWERNSNWPLPPNTTKEMWLKKPQKASPNNSRNKPIPQEELERNSNWPFPARKRTTSQSAQPAPRPRTLSGGKSRERTQSDAKSNLPPAISAPKKPVEPVIPFYLSKVPLRDPGATTISPLLARDSIGLIRFDVRLPYTSARKLVPGPYWTHLNHEDLKQPACKPHRTQMRIYTHITGSDWIVNARPSSRPYVTVQDVLIAVCETFSVPIDHQRWARDSVNPKLADRLGRAYTRRVEKYESTRTVGYEKVRKAGLLRVDYLGSKYIFAGLMLCYGGDGSDWWMMDVVAE